MLYKKIILIEEKFLIYILNNIIMLNGNNTYFHLIIFLFEKE